MKSAPTIPIDSKIRGPVPLNRNTDYPGRLYVPRHDVCEGTGKVRPLRELTVDLIGHAIVECEAEVTAAGGGYGYEGPVTVSLSLHDLAEQLSRSGYVIMTADDYTAILQHLAYIMQTLTDGDLQNA